jgi:cytochrome oxidase Cu insertion factor (SCO1/SenC/PrrC family)
MTSRAWRSLELKASLAAVGSVVVVAATLGAGWSRAQDGAAAAPAAPAAAAEAQEAALSGSPNPFAARFPNLVLRTHEGKTVRFYDDLLKGKIVLINFMYADCKRR